MMLYVGLNIKLTSKEKENLATTMIPYNSFYTLNFQQFVTLQPLAVMGLFIFCVYLLQSVCGSV